MNKTGNLLRFLGQNSFILTDSKGFTIAIDPYLSDWCATRGTSTEPTAKSRRFPPAISPEDLNVDLVLLTHSHCDHADPETLKALASKAHIPVVGPWDALKVAEQAGITAARLRLIHPGEELTFYNKPDVLAATEKSHKGSDGHGLRLTATFALPTDGSDLNHLGYLLQFSDGSTFWNTGDTAWCDTLSMLAAGEVVKTIQEWKAAAPGGTAKYGPDVMVVCINAGYGNLSHWDASRLAGAAHARYVVPAHWDLFPHNSLNPEPFRTSLNKNAPGSAYFLMERDRDYRLSQGNLEAAD